MSDHMPRPEKQTPLQGHGPLTQRLWIPACMPSLNQLIGGKVRDRIALKRQWLDVVTGCANVAKLKAHLGPVTMRYDCFETGKGQLRDPSNIYAGAMKVAEDALVTAGILRDDDQTTIRGIEFAPIIHRPREPGVGITITDV